MQKRLALGPEEPAFGDALPNPLDDLAHVAEQVAKGDAVGQAHFVASLFGIAAKPRSSRSALYFGSFMPSHNFRDDFHRSCAKCWKFAKPGLAKAFMFIRL
jgi:hypothetical protein